MSFYLDPKVNCESNLIGSEYLHRYLGSLTCRGFPRLKSNLFYYNLLIVETVHVQNKRKKYYCKHIESAILFNDNTKLKNNMCYSFDLN